MAKLGFKFCLANTPKDDARNLRRFVKEDLPVLQSKVAKVLGTKNIASQAAILNPPPSRSIIPAAHFDKMPVWKEYFEKLGSLAEQDCKSLSLHCLDVGKESSLYEMITNRKRILVATIKEAIRGGIFVAKADKDSSMVVIDQDLYFRAEDELLLTLKVNKLTSTREEISKCCFEAYDKIVFALERLDSLPRVVERWLAEGRNLLTFPKLKLLFKTHKPMAKWWLGGLVPPARPIVTQHAWLTKCPGLILTKVLGHILGLVRIDHPILLLRNGAELVQKMCLDRMLGSRALEIATADFDSLYSNLPIPLVVKACQFFCHKYRDCTILKKDFSFLFQNVQVDLANFSVPEFSRGYPCEIVTVLDALLFLVLSLNVFISGRGGIYAQTEGIAMGLGCAPILADLTLGYIEIQNREVFSGTFVTRYLDDLLLICKPQDLGSAKKNITALYPLQLSWSPTALVTPTPYLDVAIHNGPGGLECGVFFKPENNGMFLPYISAHPLCQRVSWLHGEMVRFARICSTEKHFAAARTRLCLAAVARGYPTKIISRYVSSVKWLAPVPTRAREKGGPTVAVSWPCSCPPPRAPGEVVRLLRVPPQSVQNIVAGLQNPLLHHSIPP